MCPAICSRCVVEAVPLDAEQTPFSWTGCSATCWLVPMHFFYSETNKWLKDWVKQWARLLSVILPIPLTIIISQRNFFFFCQCLVTTQNLQSMETFLTLDLSQDLKSGGTFSSNKQVAASTDSARLLPSHSSSQCRLGNTLCLYLPIRPAQAVPEPSPKNSATDCQWLCSQNFNCLLE